MPILNKDMTVCISLAGRPSNIGTRFHNYLYDELGLNFIYKAFSTNDIGGAIAGVRALGIRGCSVSMPFKEAVISLVDELEESAAMIESVNTIVNDGGYLRASNTDVEAVSALIASHALDCDAAVTVQGSGGMAKAVVAAFRAAGFESVTVAARNDTTGRALATKFGYRFAHACEAGSDIIVNATPLGMSGRDHAVQAFDADIVNSAQVVFDVVAFPVETPLIAAARAAGRHIITGAEVIALQAAAQFEKYTGVAVTSDQVQRASEFSRR